jgi:hypothetical protein
MLKIVGRHGLTWLELLRGSVFATRSGLLAFDKANGGIDDRLCCEAMEILFSRPKISPGK